MRLQECEEILGILSHAKTQEHQVKLTFTIKKTIEIPLNAIDEQLLQVMVGKKIAIINCSGNIKIRMLSK